jgi:hypothetical protein
MPTVTLIDGSRVDSSSEAYRHECECREIAGRSLEARREYLAHVEHKRGADAAQRMRDTLTQLWKAKA